jgi:V/A-type H+-transporting ATPase subunit I
MAVEKMKVINIIGGINDMDKAAQIVVLNGSVHMLDAISELKNNLLRSEGREEGKEDTEALDIRPYASKEDFSQDEKIIKSLHDLLNIKPRIIRELINESFDYHGTMEKLQEKYQDVKEVVERIAKLSEGIAIRQEYIKNINYAKHAGLDVGALLSLQNFQFEMMTLTREKFKKIKLNYEHIPSVIIDLGIVDESNVVAAITPHETKEDAERVFTSLNVMRLELPRGYSGDTEAIQRTLKTEIRDMRKEIDEHKTKVQASRDKYEDIIRKAYTALVLEQRQENVKSEMAVGQNLFYMFGFVPESDIDKINKQVESEFEEQFMMASMDAEERKYGHSPPTKLVNNPLFRPFESLVTMYGIPNYDEKDPTPFFAITYMLMFGAMFGDLGQGFIIFLGGLGLKYILKNQTFGGIISRLGISSMIFGVLYGSVFGSENLIPGLLIKPMENINTILISAVILGVILLNISYIYSLINHFRRRDLEE